MRNHILDIFKIVGIIIVCLYHWDWFPTFHHAYLPVELFFMVSGYFIYKESKRDYGIGLFIKKKVKRLFLPYLLALPIFVLLVYAKPNLFGSDYDFWPSILFNGLGLNYIVDSSSLFGYKIIAYNAYCWYISALFYGGIFIFFLLKYTSRKCYVTVLSVITICVYTHMLLTYEMLHFHYMGYIYLPLFRGIAGMSVGCMLATKECSNVICRLAGNNGFRLFLNLLSIVAILCVAILICTPNKVPVLAVPLYFVILICTIPSYGLVKGLWLSDLNTKSLFSKIKLPDITLEMLLLHKATIYPSVILCDKLGVLNNTAIKVVISIAITMLASFIFKKVVDIILLSMRRTDVPVITVKIGE